MSLFVDAHCHVDRYHDPPALLRAAAAADVVTIAVTELPSAFQRLDLSLRGVRRLRLALGMHPLRAGTASAMELRLFSRLLEGTTFIGEIGLDFSTPGKATRRRQIEVFERVLAEPAIATKILSVHTRRAEADSIARLSQAGALAILHWYSGPARHIDDALAAGMYFSVNPSMLGSRSGQRILDALPPERVLTETDGPYTKVGNRNAEPRDIPWLVARLAARWRIPEAQAGDRIAENMRLLAQAAKAASTSSSTARSRTPTSPQLTDR
jgi:TatD DNase family protein